MIRYVKSLMVAVSLVLMGAGLEAQTPTSQKVIRDPNEYNAYISALNAVDPAAKAAAMEAFSHKYPGSIMRLEALEQAMAAYQQAGNTAKVAEKAREILALEPSHVRALAILAYLARARASTGDKEMLKALSARAQAGLGALEAWRRPEGATEAEFEKMRIQMLVIFNGAAGFAALQEKDYVKAREYLGRAVALDGIDLQNVYQLGIAELEMAPLDASGFWHVARAMQLAGANAAGRQSIEAYGKAKYRKFHGGVDGWDELVKAAATQTDLPAGFAATVKRAPTPAEIAVQAVQENDPGTLSFSDYEYILSFRDASPANKMAADKVWATIVGKQNGGKSKLKFMGVMVISAAGGKVLLALTDDHVAAGSADLEVVLADPRASLPKAGDKVDVTGLMTGYVPKPFRFTMADGELSK